MRCVCELNSSEIGRQETDACKMEVPNVKWEGA